jgi:NCS1 family nucleobase:cation symporter-1
MPAQGCALLVQFAMQERSMPDSTSRPEPPVSVSAIAATQPVPPHLRNLDWLNIAYLWFGAAIAITEIWAGGLSSLTALGLALGVAAILLGRVIGNGLMAAVGQIGAQTGLPGMVLSRAALGVKGSYALAVLNVLQLVGWTGWMLFVGFQYCDTLAGALHWPTSDHAPAMKYVWVLLLAVLCTLWAVGGEGFWKGVQTLSAVLLGLLTVGMTVLVLRSYDVGSLLHGVKTSGLAVLAGADVIIAMSVSWVPLVPDYSRYAKTLRAGSGGTFWGYFVGGVWMSATGLLVALAAQTDAPDVMVVKVMGQAGYAWALLAVGLVLFSTVTTTFLDIFSGVVSAQNIAPRLPLRLGSIVCGALGALCALALDVNAYQPFLLALGELFLPAFTVVAVDYFLLRRQRLSAEGGGAAEWMRRAVNWPGVLAWLLGLVVYDWAQGGLLLGTFGGLLVHGYQSPLAPWPCGSSLPCLAVSALAYLLLARPMPERRYL